MAGEGEALATPMTSRQLTLWLRALRYFGDLLRQHGLCGKGWPDYACGQPAGHDGRCA